MEVVDAVWVLTLVAVCLHVLVVLIACQVFIQLSTGRACMCRQTRIQLLQTLRWFPRERIRFSECSGCTHSQHHIAHTLFNTYCCICVCLCDGFLARLFGFRTHHFYQHVVLYAALLFMFVQCLRSKACVMVHYSAGVVLMVAQFVMEVLSW